MDSPTVVQAADMRPPSGASGATAQQRLANTGTTEAENATALTVGELATLMVGAAAIRVSFGSAASFATATTDLIVPAYGRFDWMVSPRDAFVSIEAADGSSAYEAWVWTSSGPRAAT
jgi:hypothetical protein